MHRRGGRVDAHARGAGAPPPVPAPPQAAWQVGGWPQPRRRAAQHSPRSLPGSALVFGGDQLVDKRRRAGPLQPVFHGILHLAISLQVLPLVTSLGGL